MEMKTKILDIKHIIIISISILALIISYFNVSYAYFSDSKNQPISIKSVNTFGESVVYNTDVELNGTLTYTNNKTNMLKNNNILSFTKDNVETHDYLLTVATQVEPHTTEYEENEYISISYEIYHKTDINLDTSSFTCVEGKYNDGDTCNTGTFIENSLNGLPFELIKDYRITDTNTHYFDVYIYLNNDTTSKMFKTRIFYLDKEVEKEKVEAPEHFNEPEISNGLVPVKYVTNEDDSGNWVITTKDDEDWYNYNNQEWANAVSLDLSTDEQKSKLLNEDGSYKVGTELILPDGTSNDSDILAMFVWIPRFSYTIGCTSTDSCLGYKVEGASDLSESTPGAIDIKFVSKDTLEDPGIANGTYPTYTYTSENDRNPTNYYTHPAFNFGGTPLSGIWVGKFETSVNPNSTCYITNLISKSSTSISTNCAASQEDVTPRILPNVLSLVNQTIYNEFETAKKFTSNTMYGLTTNTDSHMMKNSEWGAVAYLSQSIYGKYGNPNYEGTNKEIYKNDSGFSANSYTDWARYTGRSQGLAPATSSYDEQGTYNYDVDNSGTGASTTGNIYGIYDMVGGAYEYVMGYYTEASSVFGSASSSNTSEFTNEKKPDSKYFDGYKGTISGDTKTIDLFTKSNEVIGHATAEMKLWYSDRASSISASYPWVQRGGYFVDRFGAGAFGSSYYNGRAYSYFSFRSVLATIE